MGGRARKARESRENAGEGRAMETKHFARLSPRRRAASIRDMAFDVARLLCGLLIVAFHRPLADFILQQEAQLMASISRRGVSMPLPSQSTARNLYFGIGMFVCLLSLVRLWTTMHP